jgi:hypothetical protein
MDERSEISAEIHALREENTAGFRSILTTLEQILVTLKTMDLDTRERIVRLEMRVKVLEDIQ